MINFYPGPSKLYPEIGTYLQEAFASGILEMNHRSGAFMELFAATKKLLRQNLNIPADYEMVLVSSATECWEIISQSFVEKASTHFYNGAFGEKWFQYAKNIHPSSKANLFDLNGLPKIDQLTDSPELLAFTHNETSNGTALPGAFVKDVRESFPHALVAYDCTSSMAGMELPWEHGDIWYASVQKCFGLPPGLAVMVISPKAVSRAEAINDNQFYNSFNYILDNARNNQTHHTPNITNIFLLNRTVQSNPRVEVAAQSLTDRKAYFLQQIAAFPLLENCVAKKELQSDTVICLKAKEELVSDLKIEAKKNDILLGNGYGSLKNTTVRIANFPALTIQDFEHLLIFLKDFFKRY